MLDKLIALNGFLAPIMILGQIINQFKFTQMLEQAGFELKYTFGDYQLNKFDSSVSPRLIFVATKY